MNDFRDDSPGEYSPRKMTKLQNSLTASDWLAEGGDDSIPIQGFPHYFDVILSVLLKDGHVMCTLRPTCVTWDTPGLSEELVYLFIIKL